MRDPKALVSDGFSATELKDGLDLTLSAAHLAIHSYCATTHALRGRLHVTEVAAEDQQQKLYDANLGNDYQRLAYQSVVHFQHFAELVVKQALRGDHELLVVLTGKNHVHLHQLLHGDVVDSGNAIQTIEFSEALERCCALLKANRLKTPGYEFIQEHHQFLVALNSLRNRLWHRGSFVLRYHALDELIGGHGLSFLQKAVSHPSLRDWEPVWKHEPLACGIDPIPLISSEMARTKPSSKKVALLKALVRAAYQNPLLNIPGWCDDRDRETADCAVAASTAPHAEGYQVTKCPVCGVRSHVILTSWADEGGRETLFTYRSHCYCCELELYADYGNASDHGLAGIDDYWREI